MKKYEFTAKIEKHGEIDAAYVVFPFDVPTEFGVRGQVKVVAEFDGALYRGSLAPMGGARHALGLTKAIRKSISKQAGDDVSVVVYKDEEPRMVEIPVDLASAFAGNTIAAERFASLPYTIRKEYCQSVKEAKRDETRARRIEKILLELNK